MKCNRRTLSSGCAAAFVASMSWLVWHLPAFMSGLDSLSLRFLARSGRSDLFNKADVTPNLGGVFGGHIDIIDITAFCTLYLHRWSPRSRRCAWSLGAVSALIGLHCLLAA